MELPKNITQIGEVNPFCKIYVEDYVISYLKQLNQVAVNKDMAAALYGERKTEGEITYLFLYGACKMDFLQRETRHLSQAQKQEAERLRRKYFTGYEFLGYRILNGEMIEGFHVCEQEICRYIEGYAQFYTKNEAMLAYMLETREQESQPEIVDHTKYEEVRKRQESRKQQDTGIGEAAEGSKLTGNSHLPETDAKKQENNSILKGTKVKTGGMGTMKLATVAVFMLLCIAGLSNLGGVEGVEDLQNAAENIVAGITEQKLPDAEEVVALPTASNENVVAEVSSTVVTQDKLTEALQQENQGMWATAPSVEESSAELQQVDGSWETTDVAAVPQELSEPEQSIAPQETLGSEQNIALQENLESEQAIEQENSLQEVSEPVEQTVAEPMAYTINEGDTLIGICIKTYGSDTRVEEVCELNGIVDPDDIKVGKKILLPQ